MESKTVAAFDFDGTLTRRDSFIQFALYVRGLAGLLRACAVASPWLVAWKLHLCPGGTAKQKLFSRLYKGMSIGEFRNYGISFASKIKEMENKDMVKELKQHIDSGHEVFIVSASVPEWIEAWAAGYGISRTHIIGTGIELDEAGRITGRFTTPNCVGKEKVHRLEREIGPLGDFLLYAYGNSSGDLPLLDAADHPTLLKT